jgi:sRNA-binding carbon storage regulator CsrA
VVEEGMGEIEYRGPEQIVWRRFDECIILERAGQQVVICALGQENERTRIGIEAPASVRILREELRRRAPRSA